MGQPILVLVTGLQGTGKSTVAGLVANLLGAPLIAHDWAMSGLRPFPEVQAALDAMEPPGHGRVGWSLLRALAQSELRRGSSVVLDGVARTPQVETLRLLAAEEGARFLVIMTECSDPVLHRSRVDGRARDSRLARAGLEPCGGVAQKLGPRHVCGPEGRYSGTPVNGPAHPRRSCRWTAMTAPAGSVTHCGTLGRIDSSGAVPKDSRRRVADMGTDT